MSDYIPIQNYSWKRDFGQQFSDTEHLANEDVRIEELNTVFESIGDNTSIELVRMEIDEEWPMEPHEACYSVSMPSYTYTTISNSSSLESTGRSFFNQEEELRPLEPVAVILENGEEGQLQLIEQPAARALTTQEDQAAPPMIQVEPPAALPLELQENPKAHFHFQDSAEITMEQVDVLLTENGYCRKCFAVDKWVKLCTFEKLYFHMLRTHHDLGF